MTTPAGPAGGAHDPGLSAVMSERRQLINLAYRLLGSLAPGRPGPSLAAIGGVPDQADE